MSRRTRHASSNVLNPNLTALLDVVLQLITFFMMLVHFGTRLEGATKAVRLPLAPAALPGTDLTFDRLAVAMNAQGRLLVKGQALDDDGGERILGGRSQGPSSRARNSGRGCHSRRRIADCRHLARRSSRIVRGGRARARRGTGQGIRPLQPGRVAEPHAMSIASGLQIGPELARGRSQILPAGGESAPRVAELSPGPARRSRLSRDADARHGLSASGLLHHHLQTSHGRDSPRPRSSSHARGAAVSITWKRSAHAGPKRRHRPGKRPPGPCRGRRPRRLEGPEARRSTAFRDLATLGKRLRLYTQLLEGKPLRVRLVADDSLRYEPAARIIAACSAAGVAAIRLTPPGATPSLPGGGERPAGIGTTRPRPGAGKPAMKRGVCLLVIVSAVGEPGTGMPGVIADDDDQQTSHQLSLADLAGYRAALSGKPTADCARAADPPSEVKFKDLWNRPDDLSRPARHGAEDGSCGPSARGRSAASPRWRKSGSHRRPAILSVRYSHNPPHSMQEPAASEARSGPSAKKAPKGRRADVMPAGGQTVRFTGTFLKMVRYAGADGPRLAPLIVGDQRPEVSSPEPAESRVDRPSLETPGRPVGDPACFLALGLALAAMAAILLARWHMRAPMPSTAARAKSATLTPDPRLEFIEPPDEP